MSKISILIVDRAVVARRLVAEVLARDPALEVVGTAPNGNIALAKIAQLNPDLLVVSARESSKEDLETLNVLRRAHPLLPVVEHGGQLRSDFSSGSDTRLGLPDCNGNDGTDEVLQRLGEQLIPRIKLSYERNLATGRTSPAPPPLANAAGKPDGWNSALRRRIEIVAIGASTGGPKALAALLSSLPATFPVPIVIVQHMLPSFTSSLANQLTSQSTLPVWEAISESTLLPGQAWIAPGDHHLELERSVETVRLRLQQGPPEQSCRPSVNVLFRSVAQAYGAGALGVVLTGMGQDGLDGCARMREAGGQILAQDEATSVVWGMPGAVARAGLADAVLPLELLGAEIQRRVRRDRPLSFHG
jgi:two-component system chemotaxis response regulator CheB